MEWYGVFGVQHKLPGPSAMACLKTLGSDADPQLPSTTADATSAGGSTHQRVAVVATTPTHLALPQAVMAAWEAYCHRQGCALLRLKIAADTPASFAQSRWLRLLHDDVWKQFDWVIHIDAHAMIMNPRESFQPFITGSSHHIGLALNNDGDVSTAAVLMRTTAFSACFVRHWMQYGATPRAGLDAGDLQQAVLDFVDPDLGLYCDTQRPKYDATRDQHDWTPYVKKFLACFARVHMRLPMAHLALPLRFYMPMTGLLHSMAHHQPNDLITTVEQAVWEGLYRHCWSTDFIRHGYKGVGKLAAGRRSGRAGIMRRCRHLTQQAELRIAQKCCIWHYPGCISHGGFNRCRHLDNCRWWDDNANSGTGLPQVPCQEHNNHWASVQSGFRPFLEHPGNRTLAAGRLAGNRTARAVPGT